MKRVILFAALIAWSGLASAVVYKWTDAQGKVQYGDRPPDGVHAELVEGLGTHAPRSAATSPPPAAPKVAADVKSATDNQAKKDVAEDVAETREKQCAEAQDHYKKLIEGRRLYKAGDNGERQYLTSEQVDSERLNAKQQIDSVCNSPT